MFVGSTANPTTRPEVNAGPIERILSPLNVGVDIGSRGVGDASGVGVGEGLAVAIGVGDGVAGGLGGSCATTRVGSRNRSAITVNTHEDIVINSFLLIVIEMELVETDYGPLLPRINADFRRSALICVNPRLILA